MTAQGWTRQLGRVIGSAMLLSMASCSPRAPSGGAAAPVRLDRAEVAACEPPAPAVQQLKPEGEERVLPAEPLRIRRLRGGELNPMLVRKANEIIRAHHQDPFGTVVPFDLEGKAFMGRIEQHFHPVGGPLKPWGLHPGCSLFIVDPQGELATRPGEQV